MSNIIMVTGGQRSGKSAYAERTALGLSPHPVYLATAHVWDEEFALRVQRHQQRRGPEWTNIEEETNLSRHDFTGRVVLVDCVTLWLTNLIASHLPNKEGTEEGLEGEDAILRQATEDFERLASQDATFIFVTNEIGLGGISPNTLQRRFTDLQGRVNQHIAQRADKVILMVSGIPVEIK